MYNNLKVSESNSLKAVIEELLEWCEKKEKEGELGRTFFNEPITESKMEKWEAENGVKIPESYKDWLRFSEKCQIDGTTATFWGSDEFNSEYVPDDLVVIGEMVGDGEVICFSKESRKFVEYYEGNIENYYENFDGILNEILRIIGKNKNGNRYDIDINEMLEKLKKLRNERRE